MKLNLHCCFRHCASPLRASKKESEKKYVQNSLYGFLLKEVVSQCRQIPTGCQCSEAS